MKNKTIIYIIIALLVILGVYLLVNKNSSKAPVVNNQPNAQVATNWAGVYEGTIPCADCEGIKMTLTLKDDNTFTLAEEYITNKEGQKVFNTEGSITWNDAKTVVTTTNKADNEQKQYSVSQGKVKMLGEAGAENSDAYVLNKVN